jgi:hypothetical protein
LPGQVKERVFAVTPTGGQIETTAGVNLSQYYACMFGGQNNPGCSGYTPQPPTGYGYLHNQAANAFASGLKVDGALTLWSFSELLAQNQRTGKGGAYISPGLVGTPLGASLGGSLVSVASYTRYTRKDRIEDEDCDSGCRIGNVSGVMITNFYLFVPGAAAEKTNRNAWKSIKNDAIETAAVALKNPACEQAIKNLFVGQGDIRSKPLELLSKLYQTESGPEQGIGYLDQYHPNDKQGPDSPKYTFATTRNDTPGKAYGNPYIIFWTPFFDHASAPSVFRGTIPYTVTGKKGEIYNLNQRLWRILNVLHELSHATDRYAHDKDDPRGFAKGGYRQAIGTPELNNEIFKACLEGTKLMNLPELKIK